MKKITTMQVFFALGISPEPKLAWAVGSIVQRMYADKYGEQPPKENRPKTSGSGTHCFAVYPPTWFKRIEGVILAQEKFHRNQLDIFA